MSDVRSFSVRVHDYDVSLQSAGSGPPLLFLHGAGGAGMWLDVHARLAERFTVFAPVQPGFAGTPLPNWVRAADDVALHTLDLVHTLGVDSPVLVGLSLGGWIATEMAVLRPRSIARLVIHTCCSARRWPSRSCHGTPRSGFRRVAFDSRSRWTAMPACFASIHRRSAMAC